MKYKKTIIIFIIILFVLNSFISVKIYKKKVFDRLLELDGEGCKSCQLYNPKVKHGLNGIYYPDKYYIVWVDGREIEDIINTENHEICHHLINQKPSHFCKK